MQSKRLAQSLVQKYSTRDPFQIATASGFIVIRTPLQGIRGFYQYVKRCHIIYVDSNLNDMDAKYVCAHELGHALLHRGYNRIFMESHTFFATNKFEIEADRFAVDILFGDEELQDFLEFPIQLAADYMGVSVPLAEYRMRSVATDVPVKY